MIIKLGQNTDVRAFSFCTLIHEWSRHVLKWQSSSVFFSETRYIRSGIDSFKMRNAIHHLQYPKPNAIHAGIIIWYSFFNRSCYIKHQTLYCNVVSIISNNAHKKYIHKGAQAHTAHIRLEHMHILIYIYVFVQIRTSLRYCMLPNVRRFAEKAINFVAHGKLFATLIKPEEEKQNTRKRLIDANRRVVASSSVYIKPLLKHKATRVDWRYVLEIYTHSHTNTSAPYILSLIQNTRMFAYHHKRNTYLCLIQ